jgi:hypothetical protein
MMIFKKDRLSLNDTNRMSNLIEILKKARTDENE